MKTTTTPVSAPAWHLVDAEEQTIGHIASKVAHVLRGKHKPTFSPHQLCGDHVVIVNADKMAISASKAMKKLYRDHTGYPGHLHTRTLGTLMKEDSSEVIELAVKGMLRNNRLRPQMLKRLHIFKGGEHTYAAQKPAPINLSAL